MKNKVKKQIYHVQGMHCSSCELLIEKKLATEKNIKSVNASVSGKTLEIIYTHKQPDIDFLNSLFKNDGYVFSKTATEEEKPIGKNRYWTGLVIPLIIISLFIAFNKLGLTGLVSVDSTSSLPVFMLLGVIAGLSTCAALVGGIVLSMAKQWSENNQSGGSLQPHIYFNAGRLISYTILGMLLGALGSAFRLSISLTSILVISISLIMIILGLQMYGVSSLQKLRIAWPKFISRYVANRSRLKSRAMPFTVGALTFFLPCGFTITAQSMALLSGSFIQGGLIMFFFALGTLPTLLTIGITSAKFLEKPRVSKLFLRVAGLIVLFFAIYNINSQLNVLGWPSLSDIITPTQQSIAASSDSESIDGLAPVVNGKQVIRMKANASGYEPNYFIVRSNVPVRWEIENVGASGCTNAIIAKSLFTGEIALTPGKISVKEFIPAKAGRYKFSCWMGMVWGTIDVIDTETAPGNLPTVSFDTIDR